MTPTPRCFLLGLSLLTACAAQPSDTGDDVTDDAGIDDPGDPTELAVDDAGFLVDRQIRWSREAQPTITGTVNGPGKRLEVRRGADRITAIDLAGTTWSITMPSGSIGVQPVDLTFVVVDEDRDRAMVSRTFAVDTTPPALSALPTDIANELNDLIAFGNDGTIVSHEHTTVGEVTLGGDGCPDVFKHAYLMDPGDSNPIRWQLRASDDGIGIDAASALVRIGKRDGSMFSAWRPIAGSNAGDTVDFELDALRSVDPFLATTEGELVVQLSVKDRFEREATFERCWTHHPLAVPLMATPPAIASGAHALFANRLEASAGFHALADELINPGAKGLSVFDYDVFNGTTEDALVTFTLTRPTLFSRRDYVKQSALRSVRDLAVGERIRCNDTDTDPRCDAPDHPNRAVCTGSTLQESPQRYVVRVFEVSANGSLGAELVPVTADAIAGKFTFELAGKIIQNTSGRRYRVMTAVRELTNLAPSGAPGDLDAGPFTEASLLSTAGTFGITGKLIGGKYTNCTRFIVVPVGTTGLENTFCTQLSEFQHYRALTRIDLATQAPLINQAAASTASAVTPRATGTLGGPRTQPAFTYSTFEVLPAAVF